MNIIEKSVTSLELSKQMQDAGIDFGETAFVWYKSEIDNCWCVGDNILQDNIPAPIFAEVWARLPDCVESKKNKGKYFLNAGKFGKKTDCAYNNIQNTFCFAHKADKKPVNAAAKLCLWCHKEGYLK
jgi:hypothetical protein